nr:MAG TPA: hypothetical protein [Caudoviricetes sp.]DAJ53721.1 MAG TPA: hypothetical protein [Caudoviricetes sp.]DAZ42864.1 MAG TPA: hypothetical protein [Caudoviricetes sp.]
MGVADTSETFKKTEGQGHYCLFPLKLRGSAATTVAGGISSPTRRHRLSDMASNRI